MCKDMDFEIFHVSNRGTNVFEQVTNQIYAVNVPAELRKPNKKVLVECIDGSISLQGGATLKSLQQLGLVCDLGNGYSTQVEAGFQSGNYSTLFTCDLQSYNNFSASDQPISFSANNKISYIISSLPEKLIFSRYAIIDSINQIITDTRLTCFTLKLTYFDQ